MINPIDRFKEAADVTNKSGRFKSAFIWNTKWKEGVRTPQHCRVENLPAAASACSCLLSALPKDTHDTLLLACCQTAV